MSRLCRPDPQHNIETKFIKAGGVVFCESDEAHGLSVIKSGQVRIQLGNRTWAELSDNDIFGEMALIDNELRSATARGPPMSSSSPSRKSNFCSWSARRFISRVPAQRLCATNKTFG